MPQIEEQIALGELKKLSDEGVIKNLFESNYASLCRTVLRIVKNEEVSEDIVQDVFVKMWNKREALTINISVKSYLFRSAINAALNHVGQQKSLPTWKKKIYINILITILKLISTTRKLKVILCMRLITCHLAVKMYLCLADLKI